MSLWIGQLPLNCGWVSPALAADARVDHKLTGNQTLTVRGNYDHFYDTNPNDAVGGTSAPSTSYLPKTPASVYKPVLLGWTDGKYYFDAEARPAAGPSIDSSRGAC